MRKLGPVGLVMLFMTGVLLVPLERPIEIADVSVVGATIACAQAAPTTDGDECDPPKIDCPGGGVTTPSPPPPSACDLAEEMCQLCETEEDEEAREWYCALCSLRESACAEFTIHDPYGIIVPGGTIIGGSG